MNLATGSRWAFRLASIALTAVATLCVMVAFAPVAGAVTYYNAALVKPDETTPLSTSGSQAKFAFSLSGELKCPADSRTPPYYDLWGYLVPAATDVTTVAFIGNEMDLSKGIQLVEYGDPFGPVLLEPYTGRLYNPGNEFSLFYIHASDLLKAGATSATWQMGLTCVPQQDGPGVHRGRPAVVWRVDIEVTASSTDPNGFTWRPLSQPGGKAGGGVTTLLITAGLIAAFLVGSALVVRGRRGRRTGPDSGRVTPVVRTRTGPSSGSSAGRPAS